MLGGASSIAGIRAFVDYRRPVNYAIKMFYDTITNSYEACFLSLGYQIAKKIVTSKAGL